jgi:hypothetical protein
MKRGAIRGASFPLISVMPKPDASYTGRQPEPVNASLLPLLFLFFLLLVVGNHFEFKRRGVDDLELGPAFGTVDDVTFFVLVFLFDLCVALWTERQLDSPPPRSCENRPSGNASNRRRETKTAGDCSEGRHYKHFPSKEKSLRGGSGEPMIGTLAQAVLPLQRVR